jgi:catechol 2,3-dioxygenase-like lactoylglutathione lyase family enzyme
VTGLVEGIGHIILPVDDMTTSLAFYRDLLGFAVRGSVDPVWTELEAGGFPLTLYRDAESPRVAMGPDGHGTPLVFHVANFAEAEAQLKEHGARVVREGDHQGLVWDPSGNVLRLHDHLEKTW